MVPSEIATLVIQPVLKSLGLYSSSAEQLLIGTAIVESGLQHLRQVDGPALGIYQMEPATHTDLWESYLRYRPHIGAKLWLYASRNTPSGAVHPDHSELVGNLFYATAAARLQYYRAKPPLPASDDVWGLAQYWKSYWCKGCVGTVDAWVSRYSATMGAR